MVDRPRGGGHRSIIVSIRVDEASDAIARIARPIHGEDELDQVLDLVGPARIVLIGEASHGTHEFYDLRASLTHGRELCEQLLREQVRIPRPAGR